MTAQRITDERLKELRRITAHGLGPLYVDTTCAFDELIERRAAISGFCKEALMAVVDGLDRYEKTVNVGQVFDGPDMHLESTTAYAARFIRSMLALAPDLGETT